MIASETLLVLHVQADLFAGAVFLQRAFNWNIYAAIFALLVIAALFTIAGIINNGNSSFYAVLSSKCCAFDRQLGLKYAM